MTSVPNVSVLDLDPDDADQKWTESQSRAIRAAISGSAEIDEDQLKAQLGGLVWPVTYTDFEFDPGMAVPRFVGCQPYDRLPFQWAMVVQEHPGGPLVPREPFLHLSDSDPRRSFAESFLDALSAEGTIVAHHASAETTVLKQLAKRLGGDLGMRLDEVCARFGDTEVIAKAGYYHPDQQGSYSIKKLAPALVGRGYSDLDISDGMAAVVAWRRAIDPQTAPEERERLRVELLQYCGRDAELMHEILEELRRLANWHPSA